MINIYDYIANENAIDANMLLQSYGYDKSDDIYTISDRLKEIVRVYKKRALDDIAKIHPDRELIKTFITPPKPVIPEPQPVQFVNASGGARHYENFVDEDKMNTELSKWQDKIEAKYKEQIALLKQQLNETKNNIQTQTSSLEMTNTHILFIVLAFGIGYLIGKK